MYKYQVHVGLVWTRTKRGNGTYVHPVRVGLILDIRRVHVGLVWIVKCISEGAVCVSVRCVKLEKS
jgi:hypothetical protein